MTEREAKTKITQAIAGAITIATAAWSQSVSCGKLPTNKEMSDVIVGVTLGAWETISKVFNTLPFEREEP